MSKDERKEMIENIAERFTQMDDVDKSYIAGYMAGKQEERQKWEQQGKTAVATAWGGRDGTTGEKCNRNIAHDV